MQQFSTSDIEKQLQLARQNLLDLTMRNRLINYLPSKLRSVKFVDETPSNAYDFLVLKGKNIDIKPHLKAKEKIEHQEETENLEQEEQKDVLEEEEKTKKDRGIRYTEFSTKQLEKSLFDVYQKARMVIEEQGYTVLFLAVGFLKWEEEKEERLSPLILIPVELFRTRVGRSFKLRWTGEDIITNISLQAKLKEAGIALPDFEMPETAKGIDKYLEKVNAATAEYNWECQQDTYLDFFSFTKFVMYNDLAPEAWPEDMSPAEHPLMQAIFYSSEQNTPQNQKIDFNNPIKNLYHVMDTDASQMAIIEDAKRGQNLVVEGPPGTGKSQTITNIIAEFMAKEKSVLFVSEKMAALDVVKNRLDKVGLGDFCLELHSRKSRKQDVLNELQRTLSVPMPQKPELEDKFLQIENLRAELNEYVHILKNPIGKIGLSPFDLNYMREEARQHFQNKDIPRMHFDNAPDITVENWEKVKALCISFAEALDVVQPVSTHPWRDCAPGIVLPSDEDSIKKKLQATISHLKNVQEKINTLQQVAKVSLPKNFTNIDTAIEAANLMATAQKVSSKVIEHREWENPTGRPQHLIDLVEKAQNIKKEILAKFEERVFSKNIAEVLREFKYSSMKMLRSLNGRFRYLCWDIRFWYKDHQARSPQEIILDLEQVNDYLNLVSEIQQKNQEGYNLFDFLWQNENSDSELLRSFMKWVEKYKFLMSREVLLPESLELVEQGVIGEKILDSINAVQDQKKSLIEDIVGLCTKVGAKLETTFGTTIGNVPIEALEKQLATWLKEIHHLQRWSQYYSIRKRCSETIAHSIVSIIDDDSLEGKDVIPCLQANLADALLEYSFTKYPLLANFISELHESKIKRFSELDQEIIYFNRHRLSHKLHSIRPQILGGASPNSEAGILLSEFNRKRGHMPIRKLMTLTGNLIQKIKPCLMMSPLSIAKFLDPRNIRFDVIIFDEASQVRPEDALGALLRGNQVIIMGDSQQLPPTSFFDSIIQETESEIASISDMESILHQCKRTFATRMLTNHYRSRHESLIAVSNKQFYHDNLTVFPSPISESENLGLHLKYSKNTVYDRGASRINLKEAKYVAKAASEHFRNFPEKSLGIGTFNIQQQQAILREIEMEMLQHPEVEEAIQADIYEPFFVKNLETIQGDERDVIFLSMGYGFDSKRKLSNNFGPLNQDGGERRLNVLITRAREKCVVFANFKASDLKVDSQSPLGLRTLKQFLEFAEHRRLQKANNDPIEDSPMKQSIEEFIEQQGYSVNCNVGYGNFRVDLAVIHPDHPNQYSLALEIDSKKYLENPFARERDRLRRQILKNLGWNIHHIWFPDWYRNKEETENRLLRVIEESNRQEINITSTEKIEIEEDIETDIETNENLQEDQQQEKEDVIQDYKQCTTLSFKFSGDIHQQPERILIEAISEVVEIEGPIHFDELARRIRYLWKVKRTSNKVTELIEQITKEAEEQGRISIKENFLWARNIANDFCVRRRFNDPVAKTELICQEEIIAAIKLVIKRQHATKLKDLVKQASRYLGFKTVTRGVSDIFSNIIEELLHQEELTKLRNGMIDLP